MSIWKTAPVGSEPTITLRDWSVFQTDTGERHFVGYNNGGQEGRVSSAIVSFDKTCQSGFTRTNRLYKLDGPSGSDADAEYVKQRWISINSVLEVVDVTGEYE